MGPRLGSGGYSKPGALDLLGGAWVEFEMVYKWDSYTHKPGMQFVSLPTKNYLKPSSLPQPVGRPLLGSFKLP